MLPKISVIVPVYNVEDYVCACIDSILQQTYQNLEIILVIDGSTDGSVGIMRDFERADRRFRVIDKKNEGDGQQGKRRIVQRTKCRNRSCDRCVFLVH